MRSQGGRHRPHSDRAHEIPGPYLSSPPLPLPRAPTGSRSRRCSSADWSPRSKSARPPSLCPRSAPIWAWTCARAAG
ncbi:hypothetical protein [Lysobacter gummosus]|uniref:hypothetical protein n=1 Tax=Lysobacter gummosus TaxID=262324 RepID=UPI003639ADD1